MENIVSITLSKDDTFEKYIQGLLIRLNSVLINKNSDYRFKCVMIKNITNESITDRFSITASNVDSHKVIENKMWHYGNFHGIITNLRYNDVVDFLNGLYLEEKNA